MARVPACAPACAHVLGTLTVGLRGTPPPGRAECGPRRQWAPARPRRRPAGRTSAAGQEAPWTPSLAQRTLTRLLCPLRGLSPSAVLCAAAPRLPGGAAVCREATREGRALPGGPLSARFGGGLLQRPRLPLPLAFPASPASRLLVAPHGREGGPAAPCRGPGSGSPFPHPHGPGGVPGPAGLRTEGSGWGPGWPSAGAGHPLAPLACPVVIKRILSGHACASSES